MGYIKSYSSGRILFKIDGDYIKDFGGMIKYKIKDNKILEYPSNEILYVIDGNYIKSFSNRILLNITSNQIKEYSGKILANYDSSLIKDYPSMVIKYKLDGSFSKKELMALFAVLYND